MGREPMTTGSCTPPEGPTTANAEIFPLIIRGWAGTGGPGTKAQAFQGCKLQIQNDLDLNNPKISTLQPINTPTSRSINLPHITPAKMSRKPPRGEYIETVSAFHFASVPIPDCAMLMRQCLQQSGHGQQSSAQSHPRGHPEHHARRKDSHPARSHDPRRPDPIPAVLVVLWGRPPEQHRCRNRSLLFP